MSPEGANLGGDGAKYLFAMEYHNNFQKLGTEFSLAAFGFLGLSLKSTIHGSQLQRFVPPEDFNLALLTLELEFVKKGAKDEQVDVVLLSQQIRKRFINQALLLVRVAYSKGKFSVINYKFPDLYATVCYGSLFTYVTNSLSNKCLNAIGPGLALTSQSYWALTPRP
ncbi:hypothetical protein HYC85_008649 [Camellia sinensis]|uniref:Uncharacterized protein n=1 Tax=Camellia sinensis TaxID=4442 RepID=A0A7J7HSE8_CAMSI|nr:hypothetical protein HYC85_008649 [Camellia sinensis]